MMTPGTKGDYAYNRLATAPDDPTTLTDNDAGINMAGYRYALIQAIPVNTNSLPAASPNAQPATSLVLGTSDPGFAVYFWSPTLGRFILDNNADAPQNGPASTAGVPEERTVEVNERIIYIALRNAPTGSQGVAFFIAAGRAVELL